MKRWCVVQFYKIKDVRDRLPEDEDQIFDSEYNAFIFNTESAALDYYAEHQYTEMFDFETNEEYCDKLAEINDNYHDLEWLENNEW